MSKSLLLIAVLLLVSIVGFANWPTTASADNHVTPVVDDLDKSMDAMKKAMRGLKKSIGDEKKQAENLALVKSFQAAVIDAKALTPPNAKALKGQEKVKFVQGFQLMLIDTLGKSLDLERAIIKGEQDSAKKLYKELGSFKKKGHNIYDK